METWGVEQGLSGLQSILYHRDYLVMSCSYELWDFEPSIAKDALILKQTSLLKS